MIRAAAVALLLASGSAVAEPPPTLALKTRGMTRAAGFLPFWLDDETGGVWLELPAKGPDGVLVELLYVEALRSGLGSNPVGLDRGQLGETRWVAFRRLGPTVLLEARNPAFRAGSASPEERLATRESFATSVLWGGTVAAEDAEHVLVDISGLLLGDAHGVVERLRETDQGEFELDPQRSAVDPRGCLAFPDNVVFESTLTYAGKEPGPLVRRTSPDPRAVTVAQQHHFIRLPDDAYRPRVHDPRTGSFAIEYRDYAASIDEPLLRRLVVRHRIAPGKPIVFHVDRGVPEPVRSALVEGASWWADAFRAAGFPDAFRVELLPEGVHPLDIRYNVIEWVHRRTRGWSYGGGIVDPRTGEIVNGHVLLGSLRVRQDRLLFEGLVGVEATGSGTENDPIELALARIRQLAAHEVGHALGLSHNFAASTWGGRASVMDYPAPKVLIDEDGRLDLSDAYGVGVGVWDRHAIRYAYAETDNPGRIAREGVERGYLYLTDADARPAGAADPRANLWDNGRDPVRALAEARAVRAIALARFGERNLAPGAPLAHLEEVLAPLYFHHRYQIDAAAKVLGGVEYHYALRGDGQTVTRRPSPARQREALRALLACVSPEALELPTDVVSLIPPRPDGEVRSREQLPSRAAPLLDPQAAAAALARTVLEALLRPERLARADEAHRIDERFPGLGEIVETITDHVLEGARHPERARAGLGRVVLAEWVELLIAARGDASRTHAQHAAVEAALARTARGLPRAERAALGGKIARFLRAPESFPPDASRPALPPPPGSPIGTGACSYAEGG